ncbi:chain length determinant protein EpsF [Pseudoduganella flava]|uniref:Chain length determinant protein EpsF n=1 Tax=Pseudoduganella flava TaxID=871742 RepID=A0A562Q4Y0_9BURK|nr:chain length determinant protein EpsF [Pseudoduganella flava]QGZ41780.1 chain length determinant protein EpsF [Pseudoduganella flava]TWI51784.1 chain length determinant protein EpsF [Pseudoduganella flava]
MNLSQLLLILRARKKMVIGTLLLVVVVTLAVSLLLPKTYQANSTLLLNYKGVDPLTGLTMPGQLMPGYMATQIDIIGSKNVALRVVDRLQLANSPAVIAQFNESTDGKGSVRDWLADLLLRKLDVTPSRESSVVSVGFSGSDPQFVAAVANAFAEEYMHASVQLKVDPMRRASNYFDQQTKLLRDNVEQAQSRLSKYQQEHGIVSVDNRLDVESNRLNDLSAQLVAAQAQLMEATSRQRMASGSAGASPDVAANPLIQNLRVGLGNAEAKLADIGQRLGRNHPQYESAQAEVAKLRRDLNEQIALTSQSVGNNATVLAQREAQIRQALAEQKAKVLELNRTRDEMNVLMKDVESAQRAFDVTSQRGSQTRIEGQAEQSDIAILNPAVVPTEPSGPRVFRNLLLSVFLGILLGFGAAIVLELLDRRVRSENDLNDALDIPLFGVIDWKEPARRKTGILASLMPRRPRLT